jgi:hypothetical protein
LRKHDFLIINDYLISLLHINFAIKCSTNQ